MRYFTIVANTNFGDRVKILYVRSLVADYQKEKIIEVEKKIYAKSCSFTVSKDRCMWRLLSAGSFFICPSIVHACGNEAKNPATQGIQVRAYDIPPHLTEEERSWFITFQEGNILSKGWQAITAELMEKTAPEQRAEQKIALANLGKKSGANGVVPML